VAALAALLILATAALCLEHHASILLPDGNGGVVWPSCVAYDANHRFAYVGGILSERLVSYNVATGVKVASVECPWVHCLIYDDQSDRLGKLGTQYYLLTGRGGTT